MQWAGTLEFSETIEMCSYNARSPFKLNAMPLRVTCQEIPKYAFKKILDRCPLQNFPNLN